MSSVSEHVEAFRAFLAESGLKVTRQREAIAEAFFATERHVTLPELLDLVRKDHDKVGYATVYRTMKLLHESGLAVEHKFADGHALYEPAHEGDHHDHLICWDCGAIVEFEDEVIEERQHGIAEREGFDVVSHRHVIYGRCVQGPSNCARAAKHGRQSLAEAVPRN